jgi:hypothetical protein
MNDCCNRLISGYLVARIASGSFRGASLVGHKGEQRALLAESGDRSFSGQDRPCRRRRSGSRRLNWSGAEEVTRARGDRGRVNESHVGPAAKICVAPHSLHLKLAPRLTTRDKPSRSVTIPVGTGSPVLGQRKSTRAGIAQHSTQGSSTVIVAAKVSGLSPYCSGKSPTKNKLSFHRSRPPIESLDGPRWITV